MTPTDRFLLAFVLAVIAMYVATMLIIYICRKREGFGDSETNDKNSSCQD